MAVVGASRRFRMVLNAESLDLAVADPLDGLVVKATMGDFQFGRQTLLIAGKAMILRSDFDTARQMIQNWLVGTAVSEFHLEGLGSRRKCEQLMAQADSEDRFLSKQIADGVDGIIKWLGVSWSIRQKNTVW